MNCPTEFCTLSLSLSLSSSPRHKGRVRPPGQLGPPYASCLLRAEAFWAMTHRTSLPSLSLSLSLLCRHPACTMQVWLVSYDNLCGFGGACGLPQHCSGGLQLILTQKFKAPVTERLKTNPCNETGRREIFELIRVRPLCHRIQQCPSGDPWTEVPAPR